MLRVAQHDNDTNEVCPYEGRLSLHLVILSETKDLGPAQLGHGWASCFAVLSMTMIILAS